MTILSQSAFGCGLVVAALVTLVACGSGDPHYGAGQADPAAGLPGFGTVDDAVTGRLTASGIGLGGTRWHGTFTPTKVLCGKDDTGHPGFDVTGTDGQGNQMMLGLAVTPLLTGGATSADFSSAGYYRYQGAPDGLRWDMNKVSLRHVQLGSGVSGLSATIDGVIACTERH